MSTNIAYLTCQHEFAALLLAHDGAGICALLLGDSEEELVADLRQRFPKAELHLDRQLLEQDLQQVAQFLRQPKQQLQLPLSLHGTEFQRSVWQVLEQIPLGQTRSYSEIAQAIGRPKSMRAVARACASNPVALQVACHRVLRSDGGISGYRWGIERKRKLLAMEASCAARS